MTPTYEIKLGDNLQIMQGMPTASIDLTYLDPPYNSGANYKTPDGAVQFCDKFDSMDDYLAFMRPIIAEIHRVLRPTGSMYLHVDDSASHYLKVLCDEIFGRAQFRNDVIWCYGLPTNAKKYYGRKHDNILFYSKGNDNNFNIQYVKHSRPVKASPRSGYLHKTGGMTQAEADHYNAIGRPLHDWWCDIAPAMHSRPELDSADRYPTQKPVKLLERIIKASSDPGDTVFDPFCGSGTTIVAAKRLGRNGIGIDCNKTAVNIARRRVAEAELSPDADIAPPTLTLLSEEE